MRCIDADALRESLDIDVFDCFKCKHGVSIYGYCSRGGEFQKACNEIEFAQTIDVAPVVHGKWERHFSRPNVYADLYWHCSACGGKQADSWADKYKFCPHCGARMDGEEGDHDRG